MDFELIYAGSYVKSEKMIQTLQSHMLYLALSGFDYMNIRFADSKPHSAGSGIPFLALFPPGITIDFSTNSKRENWAVLFHDRNADLSSEGFPCTYSKIPLIPFLHLSQDKVFQLRKVFSSITDNFQSGSPSGLKKAELQISFLLSELIAVQKNNIVHHARAESLKDAIDRDDRFQFSLKELCRASGSGSILYLRKLFYDEYGILPGKYRDKKRLNRIFELFAQTDESLKMIANDVGMKNVTHLYAFLKRHQNLTPRQLMLQFRGEKCHAPHLSRGCTT